MIYQGTLEELETRITDDGYKEYRIPGNELCLFRYHIDTLNGFKMTDEEKELGLKLCLEARLKGSVWFGDILYHDPMTETLSV
jgi:hypothetical protein